MVRALSQLIDEYEHYISQKSEKKRNAYCFGPPSQNNHHEHINPSLLHSSDPVKPTIQKINKQVVYNCLHHTFSPNIESLDYCEVVNALCDVLSLSYRNFLDKSCRPPVIHEAILKLDRKIKSLIIGKISGDLTAIATPLLKSQCHGLLSLMFVDESRSSTFSKQYLNLDRNTSSLEVDESDLQDLQQAHQQQQHLTLTTDPDQSIVDASSILINK